METNNNSASSLFLAPNMILGRLFKIDSTREYEGGDWLSIGYYMSNSGVPMIIGMQSDCNNEHRTIQAYLSSIRLTSFSEMVPKYVP